MPSGHTMHITPVPSSNSPVHLSDLFFPHFFRNRLLLVGVQTRSPHVCRRPGGEPSGEMLVEVVAGLLCNTYRASGEGRRWWLKVNLLIPDRWVVTTVSFEGSRLNVEIFVLGIRLVGDGITSYTRHAALLDQHASYGRESWVLLLLKTDLNGSIRHCPPSSNFSQIS